jgi:pyridoxamine 5'-phosphate oxidase
VSDAPPGRATAPSGQVQWRPTLPEPLPGNPLPLFTAWLDEAMQSIRNATAMALATVDADGRPAARMVLCRAVDADQGWLGFYTDTESAKGAALARHPRAAVVFFWDRFERQVRVEGPVTRAPDAAADAYWNSRARDARIAASASHQSRPLAARADFLDRMAAIAAANGDAVPRPPRWGGYRVWAERVELWVGQPGRAHDRARWTRALTPAGADVFIGGAWSGTRLQP